MSKKFRWLVAPILLFSLVACMCSGLQGLQSLGSGLQSAASQLPAILTSAPTEMGPMETMAAQQSSASGTMTPGHLDVALASVKTVLQMTQQVTFTDGTVDGQPDTTAKLTGPGASTFPAIAAGASAEFIGDPANLTRIMVTVPRTEDAATAEQGLGLINVLFSGFTPPDISLTLITWLGQNYSSLKVGDKVQTTIKNWSITLQRDPKKMVLTVDPAQ